MLPGGLLDSQSRLKGLLWPHSESKPWLERLLTTLTLCAGWAELSDAGRVAQATPRKAEALPFHIHLGLVFQLVGRSYKLFSKLSVSS